MDTSNSSLLVSSIDRRGCRVSCPSRVFTRALVVEIVFSVEQRHAAPRRAGYGSRPRPMAYLTACRAHPPFEMGGGGAGALLMTCIWRIRTTSSVVHDSAHHSAVVPPCFRRPPLQTGTATATAPCSGAPKYLFSAACAHRSIPTPETYR